MHGAYGLGELKTHCQIALAVRQEGSTILRYCHVGSGNYNPKTGRLYADIGLLTAEPAIGAAAAFAILGERLSAWQGIGMASGVVPSIGSPVAPPTGDQPAAIPA